MNASSARRLFLVGLLAAACSPIPSWGGLMMGDSLDHAKRVHPDLAEVDRLRCGPDYDAALERREGEKRERYCFRGGTLRKVLVMGSAGTLTVGG